MLTVELWVSSLIQLLSAEDTSLLLFKKYWAIIFTGLAECTGCFIDWLQLTVRQKRYIASNARKLPPFTCLQDFPSHYACTAPDMKAEVCSFSLWPTLQTFLPASSGCEQADMKTSILQCRYTLAELYLTGLRDAHCGWAFAAGLFRSRIIVLQLVCDPTGHDPRYLTL